MSRRYQRGGRADIAEHGGLVAWLVDPDADIERAAGELAVARYRRDELLDELWHAVGTKATAAAAGVTPDNLIVRLCRHRARCRQGR